MSEEKRRKSKAVSLGQGEYNLPDPEPADYRQEIPDEIFEKIDAECDQKTLSGGKPIEKFEW